MLRNTICLLILTLIFSCTANRQENVKESDFIGSWHSIKRDIPYGATLQINKDKSFQFEFGACMLQGNSIGEWFVNDKGIILNSKKADTCTLTEEFGNNCTVVKFDTLSLDNPKTKRDCVRDDIYFIIFNNSRFYIRNDSLIFESKKKNLCPEIKDIFVKK